MNQINSSSLISAPSAQTKILTMNKISNPSTFFTSKMKSIVECCSNLGNRKWKERRKYKTANQILNLKRFFRLYREMGSEKL